MEVVPQCAVECNVIKTRFGGPLSSFNFFTNAGFHQVKAEMQNNGLCKRWKYTRTVGFKKEQRAARYITISDKSMYMIQFAVIYLHIFLKKKSLNKRNETKLESAC